MNIQGGKGLLSIPGSIAILLTLIISIIFITACNSEPSVPDLPVGQVKGSVSFEEELGDPEVIFLGIDYDGYYGFDLQWQWVVKADEFSFEDVPPGEYGLIGAWERRGILYTWVIEKDGEIYTFTMPEEKGIDLGYIGVCGAQQEP